MMTKLAVTLLAAFGLGIVAVVLVTGHRDPPVKLDCEHQHIHITFADGTMLLCSPQESIDVEGKSGKEAGAKSSASPRR